MNIRKTLAAAALLVVGLAGISYAQGLFPGFPSATALTGNECIPADTNLTRGQTPATECISPDMLNNWSGVQSVRNDNTCGTPALNSADGTNATPVVTEIYYAEMHVAGGGLATGIANFNGSDATDSVKLGLFDGNGVLLASTADTQVVGTDVYQRVPFVTAVTIGPGTYYIGAKYDGNTSRYNALTVGHCGAWAVTGQTYAAAFANVTPVTTFTTAVAPMAGLY